MIGEESMFFCLETTMICRR